MLGWSNLSIRLLAPSATNRSPRKSTVKPGRQLGQVLTEEGAPHKQERRPRRNGARCRLYCCAISLRVGPNGANELRSCTVRKKLGTGARQLRASCAYQGARRPALTRARLAE